MPFLAISEYVHPAVRSAYFEYLSRREAPLWLELERKRALHSRRTFVRVLSYQGEQLVLNSWNVVHLFELAEEVIETVAASFHAAEREASQRFADGAVSDIRAETLTMTKGCAYSNGTDPDTELLTSIEYIHVPEPYRAEYHESMLTHCGPAMGAMVATGLADSFAALETTKIHWADSALPDWNQIHFVGVLAAMTPSHFEHELDAALLKNDPSCGGCNSIFGRFAEYRQKPRWDFTLEVDALSVTSSDRKLGIRSDWA